MKKMILAVALLLTGIVSAQADGREKPITIDNLPKAAQEFLATYFKDLTVAYAVEESKYFGSEYEVTYTDRTEVEFRADGQWSAVDRKYSAVPAAIVPAQIADYVKKNFAGESIRKIDRNKYTWEVELSNGLEIKFDRKFQVVEIDD